MTIEDRKEQARRRILAAACEAIAEFGFEGVRMRIVAERAGVSTALLHYHFDTREQLFLAALRYSFETTGAEDYSASPPNKSPHTWTLGRVIDACLPRTAELRRDFVLWQELWLRASRDKDSQVLAHSLYQQMHEWVSSVIRQGIEAGEFQDCDVTQVTDLLLVLTDGYGVRLLLDDPRLTLTQVRSLIWGAIRPDLGLPEKFPK